MTLSSSPNSNDVCSVDRLTGFCTRLNTLLSLFESIVIIPPHLLPPDLDFQHPLSPIPNLTISRQAIILNIKIQRPHVIAVLLLHSNKALPALESQPPLNLGAIPRPNNMRIRISSDTIFDLMSMPVHKHPIEEPLIVDHSHKPFPADEASLPPYLFLARESQVVDRRREVLLAGVFPRVDVELVVFEYDVGAFELLRVDAAFQEGDCQVVFLPAVVFAVVLLLAVADGFGRADDRWAGGYCCEYSEHHALERLGDGG
jgi:hypothetical protein